MLAGNIVVELRRHVARVGGIASVRLLVAASPQDFVGVVEVGMLPRLELIGPGLLGINTETGYQAQEFEKLVLGVEIVGYGKILACVGSAYRSVVHRVHYKSEESGYPTVRIILHLKHFLEISFLIVGGEVWIQDRILVEVAPRRLGAVHVRDAHDVTESPSAAPVCHVHIAGDHVTERAFHCPLGVVVRESSQGPQFLGTKFDTHGVFLPDSKPQRFGEPVSILAFQGLLKPFVVEGLPGHGLERIVVLIVAFTSFHIQLLKGVAQVVTRKVRSLDRETSVVGDTALVVGERLGLDDDDAVGTLRAVDCLGGSVFEDGYALDTVHIHIGHLLQSCFKTVKDEERLVGLGQEVALEVGGLGGQRGCAADLHRGHGIGVGARFKVVQNKQRRVEVFE